jgi:hypothetical protein
MDLAYQWELQDETGIPIWCDKKEKHGWKVDRRNQLKKENESQVEYTTKKISH